MFAFVPLSVGASKFTTIATSESNDYALGFSFPHMTQGAVVFTGYGSSDAMAVKSYMAGQTTTVAATSSGGFSSFARVSTSNSDVVFLGQTPSSTAIYVADNGGTPKPILSVGSAITYVSRVSVDDAGAVAFTGSGASGSRGLYYVAGAGKSPVAMVDATTMIPDSGGEVFSCIDSPALSSSNVAFFGSSCTSSQLGSSERMFHSQRASQHAVHDVASNIFAGIFFKAIPTGSAVTNYTAASAVHVAAHTSTPAPGGASGETFAAFSDPVGTNEVVAFVAVTNAGRLGIFSYSYLSGAVTVIADTSTVAPSTTSTFQDFPFEPSVHGPFTAFYAAVAGDLSGVYLHTPAGGIKALATLADSINGQQIVYMGLAARAIDDNAAAIYAVTNVDGIYSVPFERSAARSSFTKLTGNATRQ